MTTYENYQGKRDEAYRLAEQAGRLSAHARVEEGGEHHDAQEVRGWALALNSDPQTWGVIDGEDVLGHAEAAQVAAGAEIDELNVIADGLADEEAAAHDAD